MPVRNGKEVVVMLELRARLIEEANLENGKKDWKKKVKAFDRCR